ncbi:hypothetical protein HPB47_004963 [Ixodes persulcatus]|uniref:Uncharacterized protein n=1 Tax=Ixodes persulcatus TaxID=34615 RepID=A0AC60PFM4_IXOPE|nr:hypothetical protein HPB47_004963 [Ixodes persulcatus]
MGKSDARPARAKRQLSRTGQTFNDHTPIVVGNLPKPPSKTCKVVDWTKYRSHLSSLRASGQPLTTQAMAEALRLATHTVSVPTDRPNPDLEWLELRAKRRQAQRRAKRTRLPEDQVTQWASLERAQRVAWRICLGVPRTASSRHTLVESGTHSVQNAATERALRHLIRMQETPSTVSLVKNIATRRAHLATIVNLLEEIAGCPTTHITLPPPPSEPPTVKIEMNIAQMGPKRVTPATVAYQHTSQHIDEFYHGWKRTFTDGSVKAQRRTATAAAISEGHSRMEKLSFHASSTTAELAALRLGLAMTDGKQPGNLVLLTDSRAALRLLEKPDRAPALAREVMAKAQNLQKAVDALADWAHDEPNCPTSEVPAFADARLLTRRIISARHPELENGPLPAKVPGRLTRNETAVLHRLRTRNTFTPAYLAKWKDYRDDACGTCRVTADDEHLRCVCPLYKEERDELRQTYSALGCPSDTLEELIRPTATAAKARAFATCSTKKSLQEEIKVVTSDLRKNGYPKRGHYGIAVTHKPMSTIGHRLHLPKDRPPKERAQGLVYRIPCKDCPASYVGESKNFTEKLTRLKYDVLKKDVAASALPEHAEAAGHTVDFEGSTVLALERNWRKRLFVESWFIQHTKGNVNRSSGSLPSSYISGLRDVSKAPYICMFF